MSEIVSITPRTSYDFPVTPPVSINAVSGGSVGTAAGGSKKRKQILPSRLNNVMSSEIRIPQPGMSISIDTNINAPCSNTLLRGETTENEMELTMPAVIELQDISPNFDLGSIDIDDNEQTGIRKLNSIPELIQPNVTSVSQMPDPSIFNWSLISNVSTTNPLFNYFANKDTVVHPMNPFNFAYQEHPNSAAKNTDTSSSQLNDEAIVDGVSKSVGGEYPTPVGAYPPPYKDISQFFQFAAAANRIPPPNFLNMFDMSSFMTPNPNQTSPSQLPPPPSRIFNPDAFCELCNKEFCNKYFLKTHKANKHGVFDMASLNNFYVNNMNLFAPPVAAPQNLDSSNEDSQVQPTVSDMPPDIKSVINSLDNEIGACHSNLETLMTNPTTPSNSKNTQNDNSMDQSPKLEDVKVSVSRNSLIHFNTLCIDSSSSNSEKGRNYSLSNPNICSTIELPIVEVTMVNKTELTHVNLPAEACPNKKILSEYLPPSLQINQILNLQMECSTDIVVESPAITVTGVTGSNYLPKSSPISNGCGDYANINSQDSYAHESTSNCESYCEICKKEFCNKYFLKKHKKNIHGLIVTEPVIGVVLDKDKGDVRAISCNVKCDGVSSNKSFSPLNVCEEGQFNKINTSLTGELDGVAIDKQTPIYSLNHNSSSIKSSNLTSKIICCNICGKEFNNMHFLGSHMFNVHDQSIDASYKCITGISDSKAMPFSDSQGGIEMDDEGGVSREIFEREDGGYVHKTMPAVHNLTMSKSSLNRAQPHPSVITQNRRSNFHAKNGNKFYNTGGSSSKGLHCDRSHHQSYRDGFYRQRRHYLYNKDHFNRFSKYSYHSMGVSFCQVCQKELCNKYFLKTHMIKMHGISPEEAKKMLRKQFNNPTDVAHEKFECTGQGTKSKFHRDQSSGKSSSTGSEDKKGEFHKPNFTFNNLLPTMMIKTTTNIKEEDPVGRPFRDCFDDGSMNERNSTIYKRPCNNTLSNSPPDDEIMNSYYRARYMMMGSSSPKGSGDHDRVTHFRNLASSKTFIPAVIPDRTLRESQVPLVDSSIPKNIFHFSHPAPSFPNYFLPFMPYLSPKVGGGGSMMMMPDRFPYGMNPYGPQNTPIADPTTRRALLNPKTGNNGHCESQQPIACPLCGLLNENAKTFIFHMRTEHEREPPSHDRSSDKTFTKPEQEKVENIFAESFPTRNYLPAKEIKKQFNESLKNDFAENYKKYSTFFYGTNMQNGPLSREMIPREKSYVDEDDDDDEKSSRYNCNLCPRVFSYKETLKRHMKSHNLSRLSYSRYFKKSKYYQPKNYFAARKSASPCKSSSTSSCCNRNIQSLLDASQIVKNDDKMAKNTFFETTAWHSNLFQNARLTSCYGAHLDSKAKLLSPERLFANYSKTDWDATKTTKDSHGDTMHYTSNKLCKGPSCSSQYLPINQDVTTISNNTTFNNVCNVAAESFMDHHNNSTAMNHNNNNCNSNNRNMNRFCYDERMIVKSQNTDQIQSKNVEERCNSNNGSSKALQQSWDNSTTLSKDVLMQPFILRKVPTDLNVPSNTNNNQHSPIPLKNSYNGKVYQNTTCSTNLAEGKSRHILINGNNATLPSKTGDGELEDPKLPSLIYIPVFEEIREKIVGKFILEPYPLSLTHK